MRIARDPQWLEDVAARIRATTKALGLRDGEMARHAKSGVAAWSNYVNAHRPLDVEAAIRLCDRFGLTLDWFYRGDLSRVPKELADQLEPQSVRKGTVVPLKKRPKHAP